MNDILLNLVPAAKSDLQEIWKYTKKTWGGEQAENYISALRQACYNIVQSPRLGKPVAGIGKNIRLYKLHYHYIFYMEDDQGVIFLAFIHEKQDVMRNIIQRIE